MFGIHAMLAAIVKTPELAISEDEAKQLAAASGRVLSHYDIKTTQKALDWTALGICAGTIYGGRLVAISIRQKSEREKRAAERQQRGSEVTIGNGEIPVPWPPTPPVDLTGTGGMTH